MHDYTIAPPLLGSNGAPIVTVPQHWQSLGNIVIHIDLFTLYILKIEILTVHTVKYYLQNCSNSEESKNKLRQKQHYLNMGSFFAAYPELKVQYDLLGQKEKQQLSYYGILQKKLELHCIILF